MTTYKLLTAFAVHIFLYSPENKTKTNKKLGKNIEKIQGLNSPKVVERKKARLNGVEETIEKIKDVNGEQLKKDTKKLGSEQVVSTIQEVFNEEEIDNITDVNLIAQLQQIQDKKLRQEIKKIRAVSLQKLVISCLINSKPIPNKYILLFPSSVFPCLKFLISHPLNDEKKDFWLFANLLISNFKKSKPIVKKHSLVFSRYAFSSVNLFIKNKLMSSKKDGWLFARLFICSLVRSNPMEQKYICCVYSSVLPILNEWQLINILRKEMDTSENLNSQQLIQQVIAVLHGLKALKKFQYEYKKFLVSNPLQKEKQKSWFCKSETFKEEYDKISKFWQPFVLSCLKAGLFLPSFFQYVLPKNIFPCLNFFVNSAERGIKTFQIVYKNNPYSFKGMDFVCVWKDESGKSSMTLIHKEKKESLIENYCPSYAKVQSVYEDSLISSIDMSEELKPIDQEQNFSKEISSVDISTQEASLEQSIARDSDDSRSPVSSTEVFAVDANSEPIS